MPTKPKKNQPETPNKIQYRDLFQTPNFGTELLIPFIPKNIEFIWECACGSNKISNVLINKGFKVIGTDLGYPDKNDNFLNCGCPFTTYHKKTAIITNPPYSLKRKFYERCKYFNIPFALLIPADYNQWIINAIRNDNAEKIIPVQRISYLTPNILERINKRYKTNFDNINQISQEYLQKDFKKSGAQFHSMWLTWGFGLGKTETFVELTKEMKQNI